MYICIYLDQVKEQYLYFIPVNSHKEKSFFDVVNNLIV